MKKSLFAILLAVIVFSTGCQQIEDFFELVVDTQQQSVFYESCARQNDDADNIEIFWIREINAYLPLDRSDIPDILETVIVEIEEIVRTDPWTPLYFISLYGGDNNAIPLGMFHVSSDDIINYYLLLPNGEYLRLNMGC